MEFVSSGISNDVPGVVLETSEVVVSSRINNDVPGIALTSNLEALVVDCWTKQ